MSLPYAEDVNYWRTGRTSPDGWIDKAIKMLIELDAKISVKGMVWQDGHAAAVMAWTLDGESYRIMWPVLVTRDGNTDHVAARIQAATFLYRHVKARCMEAKIFGARTAFIGSLMVDRQRTVSQLANEDLRRVTPKLLEVSP